MTNAKKKPQDHRSDARNGNWGTPGTNITWDHAQGNRGKQLNPNQRRQSQASPPGRRDTIARPSGRRPR